MNKLFHKMRCVFIVVILIQQLSFICGQVIFPNVPCPDVFKYEYDGTKWTGIITLPAPNVNKVVLVANFTVLETKNYDTGKLFLNNKNFVSDIRNKNSFIYTYFFANTENIPQVTGITYNDKNVCVGPEIGNSSYITYSLSHTLNLLDFIITLSSSPVSRPKIQKNISKSNLIEYENDEKCGSIRNKRQVNEEDVDVVHFIYSGTNVPRNDHPWLVAIYQTDNGPFKFFCAGNLISNKHVLSAAHCTLNKKNIKVKVGVHDSQDFFENGAIIKNVEKIINHHEYRPGSGTADISILVLSNSVEFSEFVKPICLWNNEHDITTIIGNRGTIMGWGLTEKGDPSSVPLQTDTQIVSQQQCESVEILKQAISNTTFCAGTKGAGPCIGDSGGGLLLQRQGKWYIRGIISISVGNRRLNICDVNTYTVYADVAKYMDWIIHNMKL